VRTTGIYGLLCCFGVISETHFRLLNFVNNFQVVLSDYGLSKDVCMHAYVHACIRYVWVYVSMYVCVCMYVGMYVCMYLRKSFTQTFYD
jgi:hypothetical protein